MRNACVCIPSSTKYATPSAAAAVWQIGNFTSRCQRSVPSSSLIA
jgi:hypothetical protein